MENELLKQTTIENTQSSDTKENMTQFLDTHEAIVETNNQLDPLFTEIVTSGDIDDKIETAVNKEHIKNLLVAMKDEFLPDGSNYQDVYNKRGKSITFGLQSALKIMGYTIGNDEIGRIYGPETVAAVKEFQELHAVHADEFGLAGFETFTALAESDLDTKISQE